MFAKDPVTGIIINTEDAYYKAILAKRQEKAARQALEQRVDSLHNEISEIKAMLQQIITGNNHG